MKLSSIEAIVGALNDRDVPFLVVGGLAVAAHGYGRQTRDLDLVIRLDPDAIRFQDEYRRARIHDLAPEVPVRIVRLETLLRYHRYVETVRAFIEREAQSEGSSSPP